MSGLKIVWNTQKYNSKTVLAFLVILVLKSFLSWDISNDKHKASEREKKKTIKNYIKVLKVVGEGPFSARLSPPPSTPPLVDRAPCVKGRLSLISASAALRRTSSIIQGCNSPFYIKHALMLHSNSFWVTSYAKNITETIFKRTLRASHNFNRTNHMAM